MAMSCYLQHAIPNGLLKKYIEDAREAYKKAADITVHGIQKYLDLPCLIPQGGLYTLMKTNEDGDAFVENVLRSTGVLFIPGRGFGKTLTNGVRISYGPLVRDTGKITEGLKKVGDYLLQKK